MHNSVENSERKPAEQVHRHNPEKSVSCLEFMPLGNYRPLTWKKGDWRKSYISKYFYKICKKKENMSRGLMYGWVFCHSWVMFLNCKGETCHNGFSDLPLIWLAFKWLTSYLPPEAKHLKPVGLACMNTCTNEQDKWERRLHIIAICQGFTVIYRITYRIWCQSYPGLKE